MPFFKKKMLLCCVILKYVLCCLYFKFFICNVGQDLLFLTHTSVYAVCTFMTGDQCRIHKEFPSSEQDRTFYKGLKHVGTIFFFRILYIQFEGLRYFGHMYYTSQNFCYQASLIWFLCIFCISKTDFSCPFVLICYKFKIQWYLGPFQ